MNRLWFRAAKYSVILGGLGGLWAIACLCSSWVRGVVFGGSLLGTVNRWLHAPVDPLVDLWSDVVGMPAGGELGAWLTLILVRTLYWAAIGLGLGFTVSLLRWATREEADSLGRPGGRGGQRESQGPDVKGVHSRAKALMGVGLIVCVVVTLVGVTTFRQLRPGAVYEVLKRNGGIFGYLAIERARRDPEEVLHWCDGNLCDISIALDDYAESNGGKYPAKLSEIQRLAPLQYICLGSHRRAGALSNLDEWTDYVLLPNRTTNDPLGTVVLYCPPKNHGNREALVVRLRLREFPEDAEPPEPGDVPLAPIRCLGECVTKEEFDKLTNQFEPRIKVTP